MIQQGMSPASGEEGTHCGTHGESGHFVGEVPSSIPCHFVTWAPFFSRFTGEDVVLYHATSGGLGLDNRDIQEEHHDHHPPTCSLGLMIGAAALIATPLASAQEVMRPVGQITFTPEPIELQTDVFALQPEDRGIRTMRIEARGGTVDIQNVRLIYRSGESDRFRIREQLRPGGMTGIIRKQRPGPLREVEVSYVPQGKVTLILRAGAGPVVEPPPPPVTWNELGCKTVGFLIDRDVVNVDSSEFYRALRLRSNGLDIEMLELNVRFANGQRDSYRVNAVIRSGERSTPIDLRGERRRIVAIEFIYRSLGLSTRKTKLCVDGLQFSRAELAQEQKTTKSKRSDLLQTREDWSYHFKAIGL